MPGVYNEIVRKDNKVLIGKNGEIEQYILGECKKNQELLLLL